MLFCSVTPSLSWITTWYLKERTGSHRPKKNQMEIPRLVFCQLIIRMGSEVQRLSHLGQSPPPTPLPPKDNMEQVREQAAGSMKVLPGFALKTQHQSGLLTQSPVPRWQGSGEGCVTRLGSPPLPSRAAPGGRPRGSPGDLAPEKQVHGRAPEGELPAVPTLRTPGPLGNSACGRAHPMT